MYTRPALEHSSQFPCPPRSCSPQSPSALLPSRRSALHFHSPRAPADSTLRSRQSHCSSSILCFQTPPHSFFFRIPPNSCLLSQLRTLREKHRWPPRRPWLSQAWPRYAELQEPSHFHVSFFEADILPRIHFTRRWPPRTCLSRVKLTNHRSRSLSARRHAWCHKPAEVGV